MNKKTFHVLNSMYMMTGGRTGDDPSSTYFSDTGNYRSRFQICRTANIDHAEFSDLLKNNWDMVMEMLDDKHEQLWALSPYGIECIRGLRSKPSIWNRLKSHTEAIVVGVVTAVLSSVATYCFMKYIQ